MARLTDNMPQLTIAFGILLIVLGLGGFVASGAESVTALIPAFFGAVFAVLGFVARNEARLKHAMHGAAVLALLAIGGTFRGLLSVGQLFDGTAERPMAVGVQAIMAVLSIGYLILCVMSFIEARKARAAG